MRLVNTEIIAQRRHVTRTHHIFGEAHCKVTLTSHKGAYSYDIHKVLGREVPKKQMNGTEVAWNPHLTRGEGVQKQKLCGRYMCMPPNREVSTHDENTWRRRQTAWITKRERSVCEIGTFSERSPLLPPTDYLDTQSRERERRGEIRAIQRGLSRDHKTNSRG